MYDTTTYSYSDEETVNYGMAEDGHLILRVRGIAVHIYADGAYMTLCGDRIVDYDAANDDEDDFDFIVGLARAAKRQYRRYTWALEPMMRALAHAYGTYGGEEDVEWARERLADTFHDLWRVNNSVPPMYNDCEWHPMGAKLR